MFFRILQHLLPTGEAWRTTTSKRLRELFEGIAPTGDGVKSDADAVLLDLYPQDTTKLDAWDALFGLTAGTLTEQERRDRLEAAWSAVGGQSPRYIQDTLQGAGFDVYVYDWWEPGTEPAPGVKACPTPRNPFDVLFPTSGQSSAPIQCGEPLAQCGEVEAQAGNTLGGLGYPLANIVLRSTFDYTVTCGEPLAQCGEVEAQAGERTGFTDKRIVYQIPNDPDKWHGFMYVGAATYGDLASIPVTRRDEFEKLLLKVGPLQNWWGVMVSYV